MLLARNNILLLKGAVNFVRKLTVIRDGPGSTVDSLWSLSVTGKMAVALLFLNDSRELSRHFAGICMTPQAVIKPFRMKHLHHLGRDATGIIMQENARGMCRFRNSLDLMNSKI
mgnify:CR=1 FL=1